MFIKLIVTGIGLLLVSCSTGKYGNSSILSFGQGETTTDTGVRYLLGRGVARDDKQAFYYFSRAANDGDTFAENELAYMYAAGKGTERDYTKALYWYQQAANHGLASAQYNLGLMYLYGLGVSPNKTLARKWFQASRAHDFEPARDALVRLNA